MFTSDSQLYFVFALRQMIDFIENKSYLYTKDESSNLVQFFEKIIYFYVGDSIVYKEMFAADFFNVQFQTRLVLSQAQRLMLLKFAA